MNTQIIECPHCLHRMNHHEMLDEDFTTKTKPRAMDFTLCSSCGTFLRFEDKDVHVATEEELADLEPEQMELALAAQGLVRSEDYQRKFRAGKLGGRV